MARLVKQRRRDWKDAAFPWPVSARLWTEIRQEQSNDTGQGPPGIRLVLLAAMLALLMWVMLGG